MARRFGVKEIVKLGSNENPLGPSPRAVEAIRRAASASHRYPEDDATALRGALGRRLRCPPSRILFTAGITELIDLCVRAFAEPSSHAVVSQGSFLAYRIFLSAAGVPMTPVPLRDMAIDLPAVAAAVRDETRLIFLPNPNNPTGSCFDREGLRDFLRRIPDDVVLMLDDAYLDYVDPSDMPDTLAVVESRPRTVVGRGFSKAHGLAGLRVGYGVSSEEIVACLRKVQRPFPVTRVSLAAAAAALEDDEHLAATVRLAREGRAFLAGRLRELGFRVLDGHGNFVTFHAGASRGGALAELLFGRGIIVRPLAAFDLPEWIRVTVGLPRENERFIEALAASVRVAGEDGP